MAIELETNVKSFIVYQTDNKPTLKKYIKTISQMVDAAYDDKGGYAGDSSPRALLKNTDRAKLVFDSNSRILACALYRADLGGFKRFCSAGIRHDNNARKAVDLIVKDDIEPYDNWYWVEASGFIEKLFKKNDGNPIPNYLAAEFLKIDPTKLTLDVDGVHYIRHVGSAKVPVKKIIFGFKDRESAEKACKAVADYKEFKLDTNKIFEDDTNVDTAAQVIRRVFELHDEWKCNEMLPVWDKKLKLALSEVAAAREKYEVGSSKARMLDALISRAKTCLSEMPRLVVRRFNVEV